MSKPSRALVRFGFKQTRRSAIIIGLLAGIMMGAQGAAYAKAFPDAASRAKLVASLSSTPAVNFLAGEIRDAATPASYALYKSLPLLTIVTAAWGLMTVTRLLRGAEEDGRQELLLAGSITKRRASASLLSGFGLSFGLSAVIAFGLIAALGASADVKLSPAGAFMTTLAVFLPGVFFTGLGVAASQLAARRRQAVAYGLVPLIIFYVIRGTANSVDKLNWLKGLSPFGWSDYLNPVLGASAGWLLPPLLFAVAFGAAGLVVSKKRDYGSGLIAHSDTARSHFFGLGTPFTFALREQRWSLVWWLFGATAFAAFFAALAGTSVHLLKDSSAFSRAFAMHSDSYFKLLFLGAGLTFVALILLVMVAVTTHAIRASEASGELDNLLVRPVRRTQWLFGRVLLIFGALVLGLLLAGIALWLTSRPGHVPISFSRLLASVLSLLGVTVFTLGVGTLCYGVLPRLTAVAAAAVIGWGFFEEILSQLFHWPTWVDKTSLLGYIPIDPSKTPDWAGFSWLLGLGIALVAAGIFRFTKRDIIAE